MRPTAGRPGAVRHCRAPTSHFARAPRPVSTPNTEVRPMSHRRRRISRVLLALLGVTIAAGVISYARRGNRTQANDVAAAGTGPSQAPLQTLPAAPQSQPTL